MLQPICICQAKNFFYSMLHSTFSDTSSFYSFRRFVRHPCCVFYHLCNPNLDLLVREIIIYLSSHLSIKWRIKYLASTLLPSLGYIACTAQHNTYISTSVRWVEGSLSIVSYICKQLQHSEMAIYIT